MSLVLINRRGLLAASTALTLLFLLSGCNDAGSAVPMGSVSGTVTSNGEICGDCMLALFNTQSLRSYGGRINASGTYEVKNLPFGDYKITMVQKPTNEVNEVFDKRIPKKYRDEKSSGLSVSIDSEEQVVYDIEMLGK